MNSELSSTLEAAVRNRIALVNAGVPDSIGAIMDYQVLPSPGDPDSVTMTCQTFPWMCNYAGTLHGGMCATVVDQAMGFVSNARKGGNALVPTVQLNVNYHRPLIPGEQVLLRVRVVSETKTLLTLSCEAANASCPEKLCLSATGLYFYKATAPGEK